MNISPRTERRLWLAGPLAVALLAWGLSAVNWNGPRHLNHAIAPTSGEGTARDNVLEALGLAVPPPVVDPYAAGIAEAQAIAARLTNAWPLDDRDAFFDLLLTDKLNGAYTAAQVRSMWEDEDIREAFAVSRRIDSAIVILQEHPAITVEAFENGVLVPTLEMRLTEGDFALIEDGDAETWRLVREYDWQINQTHEHGLDTDQHDTNPFYTPLQFRLIDIDPLVPLLAEYEDAPSASDS